MSSRRVHSLTIGAWSERLRPSAHRRVRWLSGLLLLALGSGLAWPAPVNAETVLPLVMTASSSGEEAWTGAAAVRALLSRSSLLDDARVEVPQSVYEQYLRSLKAQDVAPVPFVVEEARWELRLDSANPDAPRGDLFLTQRLRIFQPGGLVPLLASAQSWQDITLDGKSATLFIQKGWWQWTPAREGVVTLRARLPLSAEQLKARNLHIEGLPAPLTSVALKASAALELRVNDALTLRGDVGKPTQGQLYLPATPQLSLEWREPTVSPERPPRYELRGLSLWNLDGKTQQVQVRLDIAIVEGATDILELSLPSSVERLDITGPDVREVQTSGAQARVYLRGKLKENTHLDVKWESALASGGLKSFEGLQVSDGHWVEGTLLVSNSEGDAEVLAEGSAGLEPIALADVSTQARALLQGKPVLAYQVTGRQFSAQVDVLRLSEFALRESIADLGQYELTYLEDGSVMGRARYEIRNRNKQFLTMRLPSGAQVLRAQVNDKTVAVSRSVQEPRAEQSFQIPLIRSTASVKGLVSFPVEVTYLTRTSSVQKKGDLSLPLPRIDLPIAYAWCHAYVPEDVKISEWRGTLKPVKQFSSETATDSLGYGVGTAAAGYSAMALPAGSGVKTTTAVLALAPGGSTDEVIEERPIVEQGSTTTGGTLSGEFLSAVPTGRRHITSSVEVAEEKPEIDIEQSPSTGIDWRSSDDEPKSYHEVNLHGRIRPSEPKKVGKKPDNRPAPVEVPQKLDPAKPAAPEPPETSDDDFSKDSEDLPVQTAPEAAPVAPPPPPPDPSMARSLAQNYWNAGKEAYDRGELEVAAKNLEKAVTYGQGAADPELSNASRLLDNVNLARGSLSLNSREEKAAGAQVQRELNANHAALEQQQQEALKRGIDAAQTGNEGEARAQLEAAERLSRQLVAQGADKREQEATLRASRDALQELDKAAEADAKALKQEVARYRAEGRYDDALSSAQKLRKRVAVSSRSAGEQDQKEVEEEIADLSVASAKSKVKGSIAAKTTTVYGGLAGAAAPVTRIPANQAPPAASTPSTPSTPSTQSEGVTLDGLIDGYVSGLPGTHLVGGSKGDVARGPVVLTEAPLALSTTHFDVGWLLDETPESHQSFLAKIQALDVIVSEAGKPTPAVDVAAPSARLNMGVLTLKATPEIQAQVESILLALEQARGPQVAVLPDASALVSSSGEAEGNCGPEGGQSNPEFERFVRRNYAWQDSAPQLVVHQFVPESPEFLLRRACLNHGQKVDVSSLYMPLSASVASRVGASWQKGTGHERFAILDEAQARTLLSLFAPFNRKTAKTSQQEALIGSSARIADARILQVRTVGEQQTRLDLNGTILNIPAGGSLLLNSQGGMTLVRVSRPHHWTEKPVPVTWLKANQSLELPHAGQHLRFEKTLLQPTDDMTLRAEYRWRGAELDLSRRAIATGGQK